MPYPPGIKRGVLSTASQPPPCRSRGWANAQNPKPSSDIYLLLLTWLRRNDIVYPAQLLPRCPVQCSCSHRGVTNPQSHPFLCRFLPGETLDSGEAWTAQPLQGSLMSCFKLCVSSMFRKPRSSAITVQAGGTAHLSTPALRSDVTTSFEWHFHPPSAIPPWAGIPSDFTSRAGSGLVKTQMGMPRTTKAAGGFPREMRVSQATCWQFSSGEMRSRTVADLNKTALLWADRSELAQSLQENFSRQRF